jgi:hypothetical protein
MPSEFYIIIDINSKRKKLAGRMSVGVIRVKAIELADYAKTLISHTNIGKLNGLQHRRAASA